MANKGQFGKGKDAKKMGHKGGEASGGNPQNLPNTGDGSNI
jgi:hypothetical protein